MPLKIGCFVKDSYHQEISKIIKNMKKKKIICKHRWGKIQSGGSDYNPMTSCLKCGAILANPEIYFYNQGYKDGKGGKKKYDFSK